jgi:hypothetical protein
MKKIFKCKLISRLATVGFLTSALTVASLFGSASSSYAASSHKTSDNCSLSMLNGRYLFSNDGFIIVGNAQIPIAYAGQETFDGKGPVTGIFTQSVNGQITRSIVYTGTYSVTSHCTGTETTKDTTGAVSQVDQFIASDGSSLTHIITDPGVVSTSILKVRAGD